MKKENLFTKILKNKIALKFSLIAVVAVIVIVVVFIFGYNNQPKADTEYLNALVSKSSELTTSKLTYTGMTEYTDTGVSFINRSDFIMVYKATVRAGIDIEQVKVSANDSEKIIYINIPKAEIQEVKVDASSIKYFDEDFALFNVDEKEDSNEAIALAEEAAEKEASNMGVLELADEQSATLIKGILSEAIPDGYTMEVKQ